MRWAHLHVRARRVPSALTVAAGAVAVVWALWRTFADSPAVNLHLVNLTVLLAVTAFAAGLSGADDVLDHTAAVRWPVRRAAHVVLVFGAVIAMLSLSRITDTHFGPISVVLRNTAGMVGLTALGAALLGTARCWIAPVAWTVLTLMPSVRPSEDVRMQVAGWLVQPPDTTAATACAVVLAATGLLGYAVHGCPRRAASQPVTDR